MEFNYIDLYKNLYKIRYKMYNLNKVYERRFGKEIKFRKKMWKVLCNKFFQKYVSDKDIVLDIAAGYCEFINNIQASKKFAIDMNPSIKKFAEKNVKAIIGDAVALKEIPDKSIDTVFVSNFYEHLTKEQIIESLKQTHRVLRDNGKLLILQPNIRYAYREYWMFFDHITPLDHDSFIRSS